MFIVVDLPEPFSPTSPSDSAAAQLKSDVVQHLHAEEALVEPADFQEEAGHRLASRHQIVADRIRDGRDEDDAALDRIDRG